MRREAVIFLAILIILSTGVIAQSNSISENVQNYIKEFVNKGGISSDEINTITPINQTSLPDEIDIKNIDENKIGIYEINYTEENVSKNVFVVTYSTDQFKKQVTAAKNIQNLYFGYSGLVDESLYLDTSTGVASGNEIGYVMLRPGSITGISSSTEISGSGKIYIKVYKNGEDTGFSNLISSDDVRKIDYDLQSEGVVNYIPGDVISVYVQSIGEVNWGNIVTIVETTI